MNEISPLSAWVKLFHPRGPQVTLPLPVDPKACLDAVNAALDVGFLVAAPGLEEGEEKEMVGYVLRGLISNDQRDTPFVLLYAANDTLTWSFLKVYLNTEADVAAFEFASKMKLKDLPEYAGGDKPQRPIGSKTHRWIVAAQRPFGVVFKKNPKHDDTEAGKMKPARVFVRWADTAPQTQEESDPVIDPAEVDELDRVIKSYENFKKVKVNMERFLGAFAGPECRVASQLRRSQWQNAINDLRGKTGAA